MIIISGSHTNIAQSLIHLFQDKDEIFAFDNHSGSISDISYLQSIFSQNSPSLFINCEEFDSIDEAEYWRSVAYDINSFGIKNAATLCAQNNTFFTHISSSYVFDGTIKTPYREDAIPAPQTVYGDSKLLGERFITELCNEYLIVRVPDYYSIETLPINQHLGFIDHNTIHCIQGQYISPISALTISEGIYDLLNQKASGIVHLAPNDFTTTENFISEMISTFNNNAGDNAKIHYEIKPIQPEKFIKPADRPVYNLLDNNFCKKYTAKCNKSWQEDLKGYFSHEIMKKTI